MLLSASRPAQPSEPLLGFAPGGSVSADGAFLPFSSTSCCAL